MGGKYIMIKKRYVSPSFFLFVILMIELCYSTIKMREIYITITQTIIQTKNKKRRINKEDAFSLFLLLTNVFY